MSLYSSQGFKTDFKGENQRRTASGLYRSLMTLQRAGPGSYNLPPLLGGMALESHKKNGPRYSIGKADKYSMKVLDKQQRQALTGEHSPGVGRYSPDVNKFRTRSPETKIGREKRFIELKHTQTLKKDVPHAYLRQDTESVGAKDIGTKFTQEKRFAIVAMKSRDKLMTPAPGQYNSHEHNTMSKTSLTLFHSRTNSFDARRNLRDKFNNKQYYKELERGYGNNASPGPGAYDSHNKFGSLSHVRKSNDNSFSKVLLLQIIVK